MRKVVGRMIMGWAWEGEDKSGRSEVISWVVLLLWNGLKGGLDGHPTLSTSFLYVNFRWQEMFHTLNATLMLTGELRISAEVPKRGVSAAH